MRIELELLSSGNLPVDLGALCFSKMISQSPGEIEKSTVLIAGRADALGEHFKLKKSESHVDEVVLSGSTERIVAAGRRMKIGRLVIEGDAGPFTGVEMSGGELEVFGKAGDCLGLAMGGGLLKVRGSAGDLCGAARPGQARGMTGGTIIVNGGVGAEAGAGMRRGLLVVGGDSGEFPGVRMLAGTFVCLGRLGSGAGLEMKRGSLVAGSSGSLLPGFRPAGEADPEWLRIYLVHLRSLGLTGLNFQDVRPPKRFTGDHLVTGKGEVLVYEILE